MAECVHDWQPAQDLAKGRFRCTKCGAVGYRGRSKGRKPADIAEYKTKPPDWIFEQTDFSDFEPFYDRHESGRLPTMDEQERQLFDYYAFDEEEEDDYGE